MTYDHEPAASKSPAPDRRWNGREWVFDAIDHIDGDPRNNDPTNLRAVEIAFNRQEPPPRG